MEPLSGYGTDVYCQNARRKIREATECPEAIVEFLVGGTQTNAVVIASMLQSYEGVVAAETGHVSVHEAGAIENTGHKVLTLPQHQGKIDAGELKTYLETFFEDGNHEHMVFPGMVYVSWPTEYGTLYSKAELEAIAEVCHAYEMPLYLDGARLGYGLMSPEADMTLPDIARICDVFYIGGTKVGALCGEAVVFPKGNAPKHFMTRIKQQGVLARTGDKYRNKSCRFYLLQHFPSTRHTFRFRVGTEFGAFLCIDAFYHLGSGILAILALINDVDGGGSGTSLVHVCLFTAQVQAMTFHYFMPGIGMVGHGVE